MALSSIDDIGHFLLGTDLPDSIYGAGGNDTIYGLGGDDTLYGDVGFNFLHGNQGEDVLVGGEGLDTLYGGKDDDSLYGNSGADELHGNLGNDCLHGNQSNDTIYGGEGNDTLRGGTYNDLLYGGVGDDSLRGDTGDDFLQGNAGNDTIGGGSGHDTLRGGKEDDLLLGGDGDDVLYADQGRDTLTGGDGQNTFFITSAALGTEPETNSTTLGLSRGFESVITDFKEDSRIMLSRPHSSSGNTADLNISQDGQDLLIELDDGLVVRLLNAMENNTSGATVEQRIEAVRESVEIIETVEAPPAPLPIAPVLGDVSPSVTFLENTVNSTAQILDSDVSLSDADSSSLDGGRLTATYSTAGLVEDQLSVKTTGNISVQNSTEVHYADIGQIGKIVTDGTNGANLVITFNGNASVSRVEELLEAIAYSNSSNTPTAARTVQISVSDGSDSVSSTQSIIVNVTEETDNTDNNAPVNALPADQTINEDNTLSFTGDNVIRVTEINNDPLTITLTGTNGAITLNGTSGLRFAAGDGQNDNTMTFTGMVTSINEALDGMSYIPTSNYYGAASIEIISNDGQASDADTLNIAIASVNDAPTVANPLVTKTATEGIMFSYQFAVNSFIDVDTGQTLTYRATTADNTALPAWLGFDASTRTFSGTPMGDDIGAVSVKVTANDGNGGIAHEIFNIAVLANQAPVLTSAITDKVATVSQVFNYNTSAHFSDPENNTLSYSVANVKYAASNPDTWAAANWLSINNSTGLLSGTPVGGDRGVIYVTVTATDSLGFSTTETFDIFIANSGYIAGTGGNDTVSGTANAEEIWADSGNDSIVPSKGGDTIHAGSGADTINAPTTSGKTIYFGAENDSIHTANAETVFGGNGNDTLLSTSSSSDYLHGGQGNDSLSAGGGANIIYGAGGNDTILSGVSGSSVETLSGGEGDDLFSISGASGNDSISGGGGADTILGSLGNDTIGLRVFSGNNTVEVIDGGAGTNVIEAGTGGTFDFSATTILNISTIKGSSSHDTIIGTGSSDTISGNKGNDSLSGGNGDDTFLFTGSTNGYDSINGGAGTDIILGSSGNDTIGLRTFTGNNTVEVIDGGTGVNVIEAGTAGTFDFSATTILNISIIKGSSSSDTIIGTIGGDTINGQGGADSIVGGGGNDVMEGSTGIDTLIGGAGNDTFILNQSSTSNRESISDMTGTTDLIAISDAVFTFATGDGSKSGVTLMDNADIFDITTNFSSGNFTNPGGGANSTATFLYDRTDGQIWYDADGYGGAGTAVHIATISNFGSYTYAASDFIGW